MERRRRWSSSAPLFQAVSTAAENSTVWVYNSQGLVEQATDTLNGVTMGEWTFSYDSTGQLLSLANDYGRVGNVVSRDAGGRITEAVSTDGQHLLMQYDAMGRLTSRDVDGVVTTYKYNEIGLLTAVQGATNVMFEYHAAHRLTAYPLPEWQRMPGSTRRLRHLAELGPITFDVRDLACDDQVVFNCRLNVVVPYSPRLLGL